MAVWLRDPRQPFKSSGSARRGVAQSGSAPALGAGCRRFESSRPDHARCARVSELGLGVGEVAMALARIYRPSKTAMQSGRRADPQMAARIRAGDPPRARPADGLVERATTR